MPSLQECTRFASRRASTGRVWDSPAFTHMLRFVGKTNSELIVFTQSKCKTWWRNVFISSSFRLSSLWAMLIRDFMCRCWWADTRTAPTEGAREQPPINTNTALTNLCLSFKHVNGFKKSPQAAALNLNTPAQLSEIQPVVACSIFFWMTKNKHFYYCHIVL